MSQKYIDFVPSKKPSNKAATTRVVRKTTTVAPRMEEAYSAPSVKKMQEPVRSAPTRKVVRTSSAPREYYSAGNAGNFSIKKEPEYGVIEDFHAKFVRAEVEKRPLSRSHFKTQESEISRIKSNNINKSLKEGNTSGGSDNKKSNDQSLKIPKSPFIAKAKVSKRPLSKNTYSKSVQPTKEPTSGPVTIITKPEPEGGKGSMVIAVILTIILGAVAGTIAFLILPK